MFRRFVKFVLSPLMGRRILQWVFEMLNIVSVRGMNFRVSTVEESGEINVIKYVFKKLLSSDSKRPFVVFDVGANVGEWSIPCLECFGECILLYSFEPLKRTFTSLESNITRHFPGLVGRRVFLFDFGFSDRESIGIMHYDMENSGLASLYSRNLGYAGGVVLNRQEEVRLRTVSQFCQEQKISEIHFLKLDTEGHDLSILGGAKNLIDKGAIDFIQFEFGSPNIDSRTFFKDFFYYLNPNYQIYRVCRDGLREIRVYKDWYEIFATVNYLAVRRAVL